MARVGGIEIPANKQAWVSLTYVFGIGETLAYKILKEAGVNPQTRIKDVSEDQLTRINSIVDKNYVVEGALRRVDRPEHPAPEGHRVLPRQPSPPRVCPCAGSGRGRTRGPGRGRGRRSRARSRRSRPLKRR